MPLPDRFVRTNGLPFEVVDLIGGGERSGMNLTRNDFHLVERKGIGREGEKYESREKVESGREKHARERVNGEIDTKGVNESEMHEIPKGVPRRTEPTGFSVEQFLGW